MMIKLLSSWEKKRGSNNRKHQTHVQNRRRDGIFPLKKRKGALNLRVLRDYDEESGIWKLMIHAVLASGPCLFEL